MHGYPTSPLNIALQVYWGHEFDISRSRDVIGHVTI